VNSNNQEFDIRRSLLRIGVGFALKGVLSSPSVKTVEAAADHLSNFDSKPTSSSLIAEDPSFLDSSFLIYHKVDYRTFKQNLLIRLNNGEQPISPQTALDVLDGQTTIPRGLKTFMVTCDDGLASQYGSVLRATQEIERETGWFIPVTFFIMTKFNDPRVPMSDVSENTPTYNDGEHDYLTLGQVMTILQERHILANHTVDHAILLSTLPEGVRNSEVETGEDRLDVIYDRAGVKRSMKMLAYPVGSYAGQLGFVEQAGFDLAFSTERTTFHTSNTRFHLGRVLK